MPLVPDEVLVVLSVLNVKPEHVNRDILLVEALLHGPNIVGADVVPAALVVAECPVRRECRRTGQSGVLAENIGGGRSRKDEDIEDTGFRDPVRSGRLGAGTTHVDPRLGAYSVEDTDG